MNKTEAEVDLYEDEIGISPGQACVFYSKNKFGDKVLGGGWITRTVQQIFIHIVINFKFKKNKTTK